jgi:hypothetical protein
MSKVKMLETRDVAPDGVTISSWEKGETYEVADPDLLALLLRDGAAEKVKPNEKKAPTETLAKPETKSLEGAEENKAEVEQPKQNGRLRRKRKS